MRELHIRVRLTVIDVKTLNDINPFFMQSTNLSPDSLVNAKVIFSLHLVRVFIHAVEFSIHCKFHTLDFVISYNAALHYSTDAPIIIPAMLLM